MASCCLSILHRFINSPRHLIKSWVISIRNRDIQSKNEHVHKLGRGGYAQQRQHNFKKQSEEIIQSGVHAAEAAKMVTAMPRHLELIEERVDKQGSFKRENTKKVADKIYDLQKKVDFGELFTERHNDILTQAIGNSEHGGRVRGVGGNVTLEEYFGKAKRRLPIGVLTVEEVAMLTKKMTLQVKAETMAEIRGGSTMGQEGSVDPLDF